VEVSAMRGRDVALIIGAVVLIILLLGLLGTGMMGWGMMGPGMMGWGGYGFSPLGWIAMLLFWALIIGGIVLLAVWFFREATPATMGPSAPSQPLDILNERYARGEITREQYEEMRHTIERR
jgi:putative membrane protein